MRLKLLVLLLYVKTSISDDIRSTTGNGENKKIAKKQPESIGKAPTAKIIGDNYNFGYEIGDGDKSHKFHKEVGDGNGRKIGSYGFTDADGRQRVVQYVADENGFRVQIKTNEPGTNTHEAAASLVQKRPTIVLMDDKDSPMTLPVKSPVEEGSPLKKHKEALSAAPSFHAPVLPNGPVRMYDTTKSTYFTGPAAQSIEYKPHPKAIQIGPLLNVIGSKVAMPMQSPILPLGPVKVARYDPHGPLVVPAKYRSPIPIPTESYVQQTPSAFIQQTPVFEAQRISSHEKTKPILRKDLQSKFLKFDPSKFNILSMYQTTLLPNGPKMYDGPVHAYVRAPPKGPPPNRLVYDEQSIRKAAPRRKLARKKKTRQGSDEGLQTTENGLELSQTIHDQSTVFYVPAEHAPPVRRRLAKPIFKQKRQPLQHGDGTPAKERNSPLTGSKPVVYDDPVGDLKPVPLFKGSSITGFLPPSGKLSGPSEAYTLVRPTVTTRSALPSIANQPPILHQPPTVQAPQLSPAPPTAAVAPQPPAVAAQSGLIAQSYQAQSPHPQPLYQARLDQPAAPQFRLAPQPTSGSEPLKIPSYPKLTEIERAAALKFAEQPLHIQSTLKEVPLQTIEHQRRPQLQILPQQQHFPQHHATPGAIREVPAPKLGLHHQPEPVQLPQAGSPSVTPQTPLHEYFAKQAPTFLQNQEAIVSKFTTTSLTVAAPHYKKYKTTEASFKQAEEKPFPPPHGPQPYGGPPQIPQPFINGQPGYVSPQLHPQLPAQNSQPTPHVTAAHHPRPQLSYHPAAAAPVGIQRTHSQVQHQTQPQPPPEAFNRPSTSVPPHALPPNFSLTNQRPIQFQEAPILQNTLPPIAPSLHPRPVPGPSDRYTTNSPQQITQSPFSVSQLPPGPHPSEHPSQHLPPQVLPSYYQQPPSHTFQPQQQQPHLQPRLPQGPIQQHLPAHQAPTGGHHLTNLHPPQTPSTQPQQISHIPPQQHLQGRPPTPQHLLSPNLQINPQPQLNINPPQHVQPQQQLRPQQLLPQQLLPPHPSQYQSIPPPQLVHAAAQQSLAPQHQHRPTQTLHQSQTPLLPQSAQFPVLHFQSKESQLSLQPQASSEEKITHARGSSPGALQAQAFVTEPRRPKSLADHSPFEYIKKSSR